MTVHFLWSILQNDNANHHVSGMIFFATFSVGKFCIYMEFFFAKQTDCVTDIPCDIFFGKVKTIRYTRSQRLYFLSFLGKLSNILYLSSSQNTKKIASLKTCEMQIQGFLRTATNILLILFSSGLSLVLRHCLPTASIHLSLNFLFVSRDVSCTLSAYK